MALGHFLKKGQEDDTGVRQVSGGWREVRVAGVCALELMSGCYWIR